MLGTESRNAEWTLGLACLFLSPRFEHCLEGHRIFRIHETLFAKLQPGLRASSPDVPDGLQPLRVIQGSRFDTDDLFLADHLVKNTGPADRAKLTDHLPTAGRVTRPRAQAVRG